MKDDDDSNGCFKTLSVFVYLEVTGAVAENVE